MITAGVNFKHERNQSKHGSRRERWRGGKEGGGREREEREEGREKLDRQELISVPEMTEPSTVMRLHREEGSASVELVLLFDRSSSAAAFEK